jgi:antirestriction protein ArdC
MTKRERTDVYQIVTDAMLKSLDNGVVPWNKPWKTRGIEGLPANLVSKRPYRGINLWLLGAMPYACNLWASYKQITERGGTFKEGEEKNSTIVTFWKMVPVKDRETGEQKTIPFLRYYRVYNLEQTEGLDKYIDAPGEPEAEDFDPIKEAEAIWQAYDGQPVVSHGSDKAAYFPGQDKILMPYKKAFKSRAEYYSTLFHEGVHSTGHKDRLNRIDALDYAREELVAEMGAAFLCHFAGIEDEACFNNSAAYIETWASRISEDPKLIVNAAARAQKATDLILGEAVKQHEVKEEKAA